MAGKARAKTMAVAAARKSDGRRRVSIALGDVSRNCSNGLQSEDMEGLVVGLAVGDSQSRGGCNRVRNSQRELPGVDGRMENVRRDCSDKSGRDKRAAAQVLSIPGTVEGKPKGDRNWSPQPDGKSYTTESNAVFESGPLLSHAGLATNVGAVDTKDHADAEIQNVILALCTPSLNTSKRYERRTRQKPACTHLDSGGSSKGGEIGLGCLLNLACSPVYANRKGKSHNKMENTEGVSFYDDVLNKEWLSDESHSIANLHSRKARRRYERKVDHCSVGSKVSSKRFRSTVGVELHKGTLNGDWSEDTFPLEIDLDKTKKRYQKINRGNGFGKRITSGDFPDSHAWCSRKRKRRGVDKVCQDDHNFTQEVLNRDWQSDDHHSVSTLNCRKTKRHPDQNVDHCSTVNKGSSRQSEEQKFERSSSVDADLYKDILNADWSVDTSPLASDFGKTKKRRQKVKRENGVVKRMVSGYFFGVHKQSTRKAKAQRVDGMLCVGRDVPEEATNRDWLSDENYSISNLNTMKTRENSDRRVDYCSDAEGLSSKQSREQTIGRTSSVGVDLYNDVLNIDWSVDTSPPAGDLVTTNKRCQKVERRSVSRRVALGGMSGVHEWPSLKRRRQEVNRMCRVGHDVHKEIAMVDSTSEIQFSLTDCPQKKKWQEGSDRCVGMIVDMKDHIPAVYEPSLEQRKPRRAKSGGNIDSSKKNMKEERIDMATKVGILQQRSPLAMDAALAVSSHGIASGKKRPSTCKKADANALGQRVITHKDWVPPVSAYGLIQEEIYTDPWKVLVACMLLNRTTGAQMRHVIWDLFNLCPTPEETLATETQKIEEVIQRLGLQHKRAQMIQRFSREYLGKDWTNVTELHGIGKYATDAYAIFCEGRWREVKPNDHKLVEYWQYLHETDGLGYGFRDDRKAH